MKRTTFESFYYSLLHVMQMIVYSVYIVSKSGGLIFNYDHIVPKVEVEQTFSYPLDFKLAVENKAIVVSFGQRDGIMGRFLHRDVLDCASVVLFHDWWCSLQSVTF